MSDILVTGGTGVVGRHLVRRLLDAGRRVRVFSRQAQPDLPGGAHARPGDLATGDGLRDAVDGTDAIVHCASATGTPFYRPARRTDVDGTRRLLAAVQDANVRHLVYISIVGIDRIPLGYYRAKWETERAIEQSGVPFTIQRTTQFHDLILGIFDTTRALPLMIAPRGFCFQPVDAGEVADRLVAMLDAGPRGRVPDMGGPEVRSLADLACVYFASSGQRKPVLSVPLPGRVARAFRAGANLCPDHADGTVTWADFLRTRRTSGQEQGS